MGGIFLLRGDDELVPMTAQPYDTEDVLQALLARFPNLLAGDQFGSAVPRRGLLISREAAVPSEEDGVGRWSLDHLFIDQDAVPTLVEVKRSSDTRIRREVVGQMLDYAANAVVFWPIQTITHAFERRCERDGLDPEAELAAVIDPDQDAETFWQQVAANLQAGRIRLVFVADEVPRELRRVVEFLNEQMKADVIAIEVKQYVGEGVKTLVPQIIGDTAAAEARKRSGMGSGRQWDDASFLRCSGGEARRDPRRCDHTSPANPARAARARPRRARWAPPHARLVLRDRSHERKSRWPMLLLTPRTARSAPIVKTWLVPARRPRRALHPLPAGASGNLQPQPGTLWRPEEWLDPRRAVIAITHHVEVVESNRTTRPSTGSPR